MYYTNRGEPFIQGISIGISNEDYQDRAIEVMLDDEEAAKLRDHLIKMYPLK